MEKCVDKAELNLEVSALSETGYVRDENQDRMSGATVPLGHLYIVADGMGGHKGGALAAELTIKGLQQHIGEAAADASVEVVLRKAFAAVNAEVYHKANNGDPKTERMGSTAVLVLIRGSIVWLAHVGDSRAYLYRKGSLDQLTKDHTWVQKMVEKGMLKPEEAQNHPESSRLLRAIGHRPEIEVDIGNGIHLNDGDAILMCSDGLSGYVPDPEISAVLDTGLSVQQIPEQLVKLALKKGGEDNITVQFIQCGRRPGSQENNLPDAEKSTSKEPKMQIRPVFQWILALVLAAATGLIGYLNLLNMKFQDDAAYMERETANLRAAIEKMKNASENESQDTSRSDKSPGKSVQLKKGPAPANQKIENNRAPHKQINPAIKKELIRLEKKLREILASLSELTAAVNEGASGRENHRKAIAKSKSTVSEQKKTSTIEQPSKTSKSGSD